MGSVVRGLCVLIDMLKTRQCLLGIRTFLGVTSRIWGFIMYILRKHLRTVRMSLNFEHDTCASVTNRPISDHRGCKLVLLVDVWLVFGSPVCLTCGAFL